MTLGYAVRDAATMLRRNLLHARRYPALTFAAVFLPVVFLLTFVYVFGGTMGAGLGAGGGSTGHGSRAAAGYLGYVTPGILVLAISSGSMSAAVAVNSDLTEGIITRFRTMAIARSSILVGHVVGSVILTVLSTIVVLGVAVLMGLRPTTGPLGWLGILGLTALVAFAITWISVALGLTSKNPEGASNAILPLQFLPFLGTAFVPADSMPTVLRWFATYQPFTPVIETFRHLLTGAAPGMDGLVAVGWALAVAAAGYLWAGWAFRRGAVR